MPTDTYEAELMFWRIMTHIFFREVRPRGAFNIPQDGPVIFAVAPHHNQFLNGLLLSQEAYRETGRRNQFLTATKSLRRKTVGFAARRMDSCIPVVRAVDEAKPETELVYLSPDDPFLLLGERTRFESEQGPAQAPAFRLSRAGKTLATVFNGYQGLTPVRTVLSLHGDGSAHGQPYRASDIDDSLNSV